MDLEFVVREEIVEVDDDIFVDAEINTVKNMVSLEDAGRVVIELEHFFKQLICQKCTVPLQLSKRIGFVHSGVTGYVVIQCQHEPCMYVCQPCSPVKTAQAGKHHQGPSDVWCQHEAVSGYVVFVDLYFYCGKLWLGPYGYDYM